MALTFTPEPELGSLCPEFELPGVDGRTWSRADFKNAQALLVMFLCNHCPYVKAVEQRLIDLGNEMKQKDVQLVAICSNDSSAYPEDSFEKLRERSKEKNYPFPYLVDESQEIAKKFGAVCTPDFFLYGPKHELVYRGRLDDSWKDPSQVKRQDLRDAIFAILKKTPAQTEQRPSMGCSIKWKK